VTGGNGGNASAQVTATGSGDLDITGSPVGGSGGAGRTSAGTDGTAFVGLDGFTSGAGYVISVEADGGGSSGIVAAFGQSTDSAAGNMVGSRGARRQRQRRKLLQTTS
jgi:hypothetical protein